ncbi:MAG: FAD-dependent oxidoreductase, partial [Candidatus Omnitrophota bacterium]
KIARQCFSGFNEACHNGRRLGAEDSFLKWIYKSFGAGIAENFMIPYNEKFWRVSLAELTYKGVDRFIVVPGIKDISKTWHGNVSQELGYNSCFWYPAQGGIETLAQAFSRDLPNLFCGCPVSEIDLSAKRIKLADGRQERFDCLVSTLPLPELSRIIVNLPADLGFQFKKLRWNSIFNLNLGIARKIDNPGHWIYFPGQEFAFFRVGCYTNFSSSLAPPDKSLIYVEVAYTADEPLNKEELEGRILRDLQKTGLLSPRDNMEICDPIDIRYGYVLYDFNHKAATETIQQYLNERNVFSIGRYGRWEYMSMEDVILDAQKAAELMLTC